MGSEAAWSAEEGAPRSLWHHPGYPAVFLLMVVVFAGWTMLLPVVPLAVIRSGGSDTLAGGTTAIFMGTTVALQVFTPSLLQRFGYRRMLLLACLLSGLPNLGYLLGLGPAVALGVSAVRGAGFGVLTVACPALIAELVPARLLGRATGLSGAGVGAAQMLFLPAGLALMSAISADVVFVLGAAVGLLASIIVIFVPSVHPQPQVAVESPPRLSAMAHLMLVPFLGMLAASVAFGGVSSFLPVAGEVLDPVAGAGAAGLALSAVGGFIMVGRLSCGIVADRRGPGGLLLPALVLAAVGLGGIAVVIAAGLSPWWLLAGAAVFGLGYGTAQNDTLLMLFARVDRSRLSVASTVWNVAYDGGMGLGALGLGIVAALLGYLELFVVAAVVVATGWLAALLLLRRQAGTRRSRQT